MDGQSGLKQNVSIVLNENKYHLYFAAPKLSRLQAGSYSGTTASFIASNGAGHEGYEPRTHHQHNLRKVRRAVRRAVFGGQCLPENLQQIDIKIFTYAASSISIYTLRDTSNHADVSFRRRQGESGM
jgi:hypothetical protein